MNVSGIEGLVANFYRADSEIGDEIKDVMQRMMDDTVDLAKQLCPVDKGHLRDSIQGSLSDGGLAYKVESSRAYLMAKTKRYYAPYVELGTVYQPAQPFLRPAWLAMRPHLKTDIRKAVQDALSRLKLT
jgi:HK97 gp10 family phage protein